MTVQSLPALVVHLEGFPTCETMLVPSAIQMFSKCLCAYLTATEEVVLPFANVLVTVAASHENMLKQLGWKTETFVTMLVVRL